MDHNSIEANPTRALVTRIRTLLVRTYGPAILDGIQVVVDPYLGGKMMVRIEEPGTFSHGELLDASIGDEDLATFLAIALYKLLSTRKSRYEILAKLIGEPQPGTIVP